LFSTGAREHMTFRALKIENMGLFPPRPSIGALIVTQSKTKSLFGYFCSIRHGNPEKS
jgi:hypothetical protein